MGILLVFVVLVIQFNQFRQAFIVLAVVPLSLIGVLLGLLITREYLSFPSMLGFIALAGIVVNNAIILVDVWNRMRRDHPDMPLRSVVIEGAALRLRPILLTTVTTIVGIAPLVFASDLWRPIAVAIMFGLFFAVMLTLMLVPVLYLKLCKKDMTSSAVGSESSEDIEEDDGREMEHIGSVLKDKYRVSSLLKSVLGFVALLALVSPLTVQAYVYDNANIHYAYHEAPTSFSVDKHGETQGATVSGMLFTQRNVTVDQNIRLQRFEIGLAYWYVSDKGVIWADNDLVALSVYLSRVV
jgi:predicted RND superfamily exporter protein